MATASAIIAQIRLRLGDTSGDFLTTDRGLTWLDEAHDQMVEILRPLKRTKSYTVAQYQEVFDLPADYIIFEVVTCTQSQRHQLEYRTPQEFEKLKMTGRQIGRPDFYTVQDGKLYVWPMFGTASKAVIINASTTTSDTTITLASTSNLRDFGRFIVGTQEEGEYTTRGSTSISVVTRGLGGTVASSHASGVSLTQTDLELQYARRASALASTGTPDTPAWTHPKLQNYVLYVAELSRGNAPKADYYWSLWQKDLEDAQFNVKKVQNQQNLRVKDVDNWSRYRREGAF